MKIKLPQSLCVKTALLILAATSQTFGAGEPAVNPTGTWELTISTSTTQTRLAGQTLKLKLDGENLTGTLSRNAGGKIEQLAIEKGKLNGNIAIAKKRRMPSSKGSSP